MVFDKYKHLFNQEALDVFKTQTSNMIFQYNVWTDPWGQELYNLIELVALLGVKEADNNPAKYTCKYSRVLSFGYTCSPNQVDDAAAKLIQAINDMAANKWINASMYNLGIIELGKINDTDPDRVCVVSHLAVKAEHDMDATETYGMLMFQEGGLPKEYK